MMTIFDLVIIVMLNSETSEVYIERIMELSEQAQDDMQKLIMRSKTSINDLPSVVSMSDFPGLTSAAS